jgi:hypothetical protein
MTDKQILDKYFEAQDYDEDEIGEWVIYYFCKYCKEGYNKKEAIEHYKEYKGKCKNESKLDKQILQKAIDKAEKNGFDYEDFYDKYGNCDNWSEFPIETNEYYILIFNHDFAKAFAKYINKSMKLLHLLRIDYAIEHYSDEHIRDVFLQQMVLSKEPLKYIEKFLGE